MTDRYFTKQTFTFLSSLAENNAREWFTAHQQEYEDFVREPALDFISDMSDEMPAISRHFLAQSKKVGGSLMRIYRDTRFSKDKTPYKTNIGIQFRLTWDFCARRWGCVFETKNQLNYLQQSWGVTLMALG